MTGHWQCQKCQGDKVKIHLLAVGGGIKEARKLECEGCGESDHYTLDLIGKESPAKTEHRKFRWIKGQIEEEKPAAQQ